MELNNEEQRRILEILKEKDAYIAELEEEFAKHKSITEEIERKLSETKLLLEATENKAYNLGLENEKHKEELLEKQKVIAEKDREIEILNEKMKEKELVVSQKYQYQILEMTEKLNQREEEIRDWNEKCNSKDKIIFQKEQELQNLALTEENSKLGTELRWRGEYDQCLKLLEEKDVELKLLYSKQFDVEILQMQNKQLNEEGSLLRKELLDVQAQLSKQYTVSIFDKEKNITKESDENNSLKAEISLLQKEVSRKCSEIENLNVEKEYFIAEVSKLKNTIFEYEEAINKFKFEEDEHILDLQRKLDEKSIQVETQVSRISEQQAEIEQLKSTNKILSNTFDAIEVGEKEEHMIVLVNQLSTYFANEYSLRKQLATLQFEISNIKAKLMSETVACEKKSKKLRHCENQVQSMKQLIEIQKTEIDAMKLSISRRENEIRDLNVSTEHFEQLNHQYKDDIDALKMQLDVQRSRFLEQVANERKQQKALLQSIQEEKISESLNLSETMQKIYEKFNTISDQLQDILINCTTPQVSNYFAPLIKKSVTYIHEISKKLQEQMLSNSGMIWQIEIYRKNVEVLEQLAEKRLDEKIIAERLYTGVKSQFEQHSESKNTHMISKITVLENQKKILAEQLYSVNKECIDATTALKQAKDDIKLQEDRIMNLEHEIARKQTEMLKIIKETEEKAFKFSKKAQDDLKLFVEKEILSQLDNPLHSERESTFVRQITGLKVSIKELNEQMICKNSTIHVLESEVATLTQVNHDLAMKLMNLPSNNSDSTIELRSKSNDQIFKLQSELLEANQKIAEQSALIENSNNQREQFDSLSKLYSEMAQNTAIQKLRLEDLEKELESAQNERKHLVDLNEVLQLDKAQLERRLQELAKTISEDAQSKVDDKLIKTIGALQNTIEKYKTELSSKENAIVALQRLYEKLETQLFKKNGSKSKENLATYLIKSKTSEIEALRRYRKALKDEIELRGKIIARDERIKELTDLLSSNNGSVVEIDKTRLDSYFVDKEIELEQMKLRILDLESKKSELEEALAKASISNSFNKISTNNVVQSPQKTKSMENIFQKAIDSQTEQLHERDGLIKQLQESLQTTQNQLESTKLELKVKQEEAQIKIDLLVRAQEQCTEQLQQYVKQNATLSSQVSQKQMEVEKCEKEYQVLKDTYNGLLEQLDTLRHSLKDKENLSQLSLLQQEESLDKTVSSLKQEQYNVQRLNMLVGNLRKQNEDLREQVSKLEAEKMTSATLSKKLKEQKLELLKKVKEAKDYIQSLRAERDQIRNDLLEKIKRLESEVQFEKELSAEKSNQFKSQIDTLQFNMKEMEHKLQEEQHNYEDKILAFEKYVRAQIDQEKARLNEEKAIMADIDQNLQRENADLKFRFEKCMEDNNQLVINFNELNNQFSLLEKQLETCQQENTRIEENYKTQLDMLKKKVKDATKTEDLMSQYKEEVKGLKMERVEMEKKIAEIEAQYNSSKERVKQLSRELNDTVKNYKIEKENLKAKMEDMERNTISEQEFEGLSIEVNELRKTVKFLQEENSRKAKLLKTIKNEKTDELDGLKKKLQELEEVADKYEKLARETSRKENLLKEYKQKIQLMETEVQNEGRDHNDLKFKINYLNNELLRKDKTIKELQNIIEQKKESVNRLQQTIKEQTETGEKKEAQLKALKTKLEKLQKLEEKKAEETTSSMQQIKSMLYEIASSQVERIQQVEKEVEQRKQAEISISTDEVLDSMSDSALSLLNLTKTELFDIMNKTKRQSSTAASPKTPLPKSSNAVNTLNYLKEILMQSESFELDFDQATAILEKLINTRIQLESQLKSIS